MENDQSKQEHNERKESKRLGRSWTEQFSGPIRWRRYSSKDAGGRPSIFFDFKLPPRVDEVPQSVYDILKELKFLDNSLSPGHGSGKQATGLVFTRDSIHGRRWRLPDTPAGRTAADIIDGKLRTLVECLESDVGNSR